MNWRIPIAPYDGVQDGDLSLVTGNQHHAVLSPPIRWLFGNFLRNWCSMTQHREHRSDRPLQRRVDDACLYPEPGVWATVTEIGQTFTLPKVEDAVLMAAPSMGAAKPSRSGTTI